MEESSAPSQKVDREQEEKAAVVLAEKLGKEGYIKIVKAKLSGGRTAHHNFHPNVRRGYKPKNNRPQIGHAKTAKGFSKQFREQFKDVLVTKGPKKPWRGSRQRQRDYVPFADIGLYMSGLMQKYGLPDAKHIKEFAGRLADDIMSESGIRKGRLEDRDKGLIRNYIEYGFFLLSLYGTKDTIDDKLGIPVTLERFFNVFDEEAGSLDLERMGLQENGFFDAFGEHTPEPDIEGVKSALRPYIQYRISLDVPREAENPGFADVGDIVEEACLKYRINRGNAGNYAHILAAHINFGIGRAMYWMLRDFEQNILGQKFKEQSPLWKIGRRMSGDEKVELEEGIIDSFGDHVIGIYGKGSNGNRPLKLEAYLGLYTAVARGFGFNRFEVECRKLKDHANRFDSSEYNPKREKVLLADAMETLGVHDEKVVLRMVAGSGIKPTYENRVGVSGVFLTMNDFMKAVKYLNDGGYIDKGRLRD